MSDAEKEGRRDAGKNQNIRSHKELRVYHNAMDATMRIFELTKSFPNEERYSLTDQVRRSSRAVCSCLGECWRKRRYKAHFISKLTDAESEAEETLVWIEIALRCGYLDPAIAGELDKAYPHILAQLVLMESQADKWLLKPKD